MKDIKNSPKKDKNKINSKFKIKLVPNINKDKKSKNNSKEKSKTSLKFEKEKKEILYENNIEDKAQLNDVFTNNNNYKNDKFLVNEEIKLLKTYEKNDSSETELIRLQKVYNTILASEKNENFQKVDSNFVKKKIQLSILNVLEPMTKLEKFRKNIELIQKKTKFQKYMNYQQIKL